jgi:23S rRNA pseudouridine1911/1915/1917 synthase
VVDPALRDALATFPRQALHATRVEFAHPATHMPTAIAAGLPSDIDALLACAGLTNAREQSSIE